MPFNVRLCTLLVSTVIAAAANGANNDPSNPGGFNKKLALKPEVKPAFHVMPMTHRFVARRGKLIPFQFELESIDRATTVTVEMVALKQDLSGTILPDTDSPAPDNVKLLSPDRMELKDNESKQIKCQVRVPLTQANFHSFGILVTDLGRVVERTPLQAGDNVTRRVGIRFVTRYMLRVDIEIEGTRGEDVSKIEIESADLVDADGFPKARAIIMNPTDSPLELQAVCRLLGGGSQIGKHKFNLVMPSRFSMDSEERHDIRILPGARIRLEELVRDVVFPGAHDLEIDLISNHRSRKKDVIPIDVRPGDFPGQDAEILQAVRDVTISPAHVELSWRRGGKRMRAIEIQNNSPETVHVDAMKSTSPREREWLIMQPSSVSIRPGSKRRIMAMIDIKQQYTASRYTKITLSLNNDRGESVGTYDLPVALLTRSEETPKLQIGSLGWDGVSQPPAFVVPINNDGEVHAALNAKLVMTDAFGRAVEMQSGYGRWLLPGKQTELRFKTEFAPPPGDYRFKLTIDGTNAMEPIEVEDMIRFSSPESDQPAPDATVELEPQPEF
jgi:hypothetical protein